MSGYREHSFDPNAGLEQGRPLRPFNWVQWLGVAFGIMGVALAVLHFAVRLGWLAERFDFGGGPAFSLTIIGVLFINSRREPRANDSQGA